MKSEILKDVPHFLNGDPQRLHQILSNLVDNGIKFSDRGEIHVKVAKEEERLDSQVTLHLTVSDTGYGVPAGQIRRYFRSLFFNWMDLPLERREVSAWGSLWPNGLLTK